jgi:AraC-like DNA-binding protein
LSIDYYFTKIASTAETRRAEEVVAEELRGIVNGLIRELYHPFEEAKELVRCFAEVALTVTESSRAEITVRSPLDAADLQVSVERAQPRRLPAPRSILFPIHYQTAELGGLLIFSPAPPLASTGAKACEWITQTLGYHLKRYEVRRLARDRYGREVPLIGTSEPLARIDRFLERASQTSLPALLLGSPGSGVEAIALALHLIGPIRDGVFVQANCATLESVSLERQVASLLRSADGGTLLFARLEDLEPRSQQLLCQILETGPAGWGTARHGRPPAVRLLATASHELAGMAQRGEFCLGLFEQLDFLRLEIEPLRNRREDVSPLIEYYLRRHAYGRAPEVSTEVLEACVKYDWPGDTAELSRVAARLAVLAGEECLLLRHVRDCTPQILGAPASTDSAGLAPGTGRGSPLPAGERGDLTRLDDCHPTLRRAIGYIADHPQAKLSLSQVASRAYVSSFHLSHLFQQELGTTFTRFLTSVRVNRAKRLLLDHPRLAITTIAAESGFFDLRHFERTFKGVVGCTPKEFRRLSGAGRRL